MLTEMVKIFMAGLVLANGPCLFICAPVILSCISGLPYLDTGVPGWKIGLRFAVIFSAARLAAYGFLGGVSVVFYKFVFAFVAPRGAYVEFALGLFIIGVGVFYIFNNPFRTDHARARCGCLRMSLDEKSSWHMVILGLLIGFSPCPPLLAMLTYISATVKDPWAGVGAGLIFGLGTLITPLIPLSVFTGLIADKVKRFRGVPWTLRFLSAAVLIYFGSRLIFR